MAVYLIGNQVERDSNSTYVSDAATTNYDPTDAINATRGGRHLKARTDAADRGIIYRNNSGNLDADCCVIAGASRMLGHRMIVRSFSDCDGYFNGGTSHAENVWDGDDFGRGLARSFTTANAEYLSISDANQSGLDFTTAMWGSVWVKLPSISTTTWTILSKYLSTGNNRSYYLFYGHTTNRFTLGTSADGTGGTFVQVAANTFGALSADTWYNVFFGIDGTNIFIGVNGGAFNTAAQSTLYGGSAAFVVGAHNDGASSRLTGQVSHVALGSNLDLGPRAIQNYLYNGGSGRTWYDWSDNVKTASGLVSHWSLKESSGNATDDYGPNDLTDNNTVTSDAGPFTYPEAVEERYSSTSIMVGPPDRTKKPQDLVHFYPQRSADFESSNSEYLSRTSADSVNLRYANESFFWIGWFNFESLSAAQRLFGRYTTSGNNRSYMLTYNTSTNQFEWFVSSDGTGGNTAQCNASTFGAASVSTWVLVYCAHEQGVGLSISVNAGNINTAVHTGGVYNPSVPLEVGRANGASYFDGKMKNLATGRGALTQAEIEFIYNSGLGRTHSDLLQISGLQEKFGSWWPMNENSGNRHDIGPWRNHLTDNNTVASSTDVPDTSRIFAGALGGQEAFGTFFGAGGGGAYTEEVPAMYFDTAFELPNPEWPVVEQPAYTSVKKGRQYLKVERATTLRVPFLTRSQVEAIKAMDLDEPIFVYDSDAKHLHDKLWHCICTISDVAQFDDQYTVTLSLQRLRHYEVAE